MEASVYEPGCAWMCVYACVHLHEMKLDAWLRVCVHMRPCTSMARQSRDSDTALSCSANPFGLKMGAHISKPISSSTLIRSEIPPSIKIIFTVLVFGPPDSSKLCQETTAQTKVFCFMSQMREFNGFQFRKNLVPSKICNRIVYVSCLLVLQLKEIGNIVCSAITFLRSASTPFLSSIPCSLSHRTFPCPLSRSPSSIYSLASPHEKGRWGENAKSEIASHLTTHRKNRQKQAKALGREKPIKFFIIHSPLAKVLE